MKICTFFGHSDTPDEIQDCLRETIRELIEKKNVQKFLVGNQGKFDGMVKRILSDFSKAYNIKYFVVLAYLPQKEDLISDTENTIFPEGIEKVPKRFSIDWRNRWMLKKSDYVVMYVKRIYDGAAKFKELAEKAGKMIINLAENGFLKQ